MHLLPTNYQKSQFCHSILTVWIARQSTSWNYLKSTWITWRPSILNFRCRNSLFIWLWIRVNGESARASFDWLQEGRPASPLALQISVSERIVPKLQAQIKERRSCTYQIISETFYPTYTTSHLDMWQSVFLHTQIGSTRSIRFAVL